MPHKTLRVRALDFLARREHSQLELKRKLFRYTPDEAVVDELLTSLYEEGLQSDARYCEQYVRSRIAAGCGPYKIATELKQRGVAEDIVAQYLTDDNYYWEQVLQTVWKKKYHNEQDQTSKMIVRQIRFFLQRGFPPDLVHRFISNINI